MESVESKARDLYRAVLQLKGIDECERFFTDLCTPAELASLSDRWAVAQLLERGVPYRQIHERTGVSTATVTRVARALTYGEGGYQAALDKRKRETSNGRGPDAKHR
jgi:TrpR-related protein YerC/YecD